MPYGKKFIDFQIQNDGPSKIINEIETKEPICLSNDLEKFLDSLNHPISSFPLDKLLKSINNSICIVIDDFTRKYPPNKFLEALIEYIQKNIAKSVKIKIIIASGTHPPPNASEIKKNLGKLADLYGIYTNDQTRSIFVHIGTTSYGTPVEINEEYINSEFKILFTDVTLHYFAGFGGDRKSIHPGLASIRTTNHNHSMVIQGKSAPGKLDGNPIHEDMLEAAKLARADFVINMCFNSNNELFAIYSGALNSAFIKACSEYLDRYSVHIQGEADLLLISPGGFPYDLNLYQSQKTLIQCNSCVKKGAPIIFFNEASGGIGNLIFETWNALYKNEKDIIEAIHTHFEQGANNVLNQINFTTRNQIFIYTELAKDKVEHFGMKKIENLDDMVNILSKDAKKIYIIKHGSKIMIENR